MANQVTTIPNGWKMTTLGEVVEFQRGFDLPTQDRIKGNYPLIASTGIDGFVKDYKVTAPGVITGRSGSLGKVLYIKENYWPLNTTLWIKDFRGNFEKFIYYWLLNFPFEKYNAGTGVPTLNRNHIHQVEVILPENSEEQRAIAAVLSSLDDKIELLREQNKTLEATAQAIFKEWFVNFNFPGANGKMIDFELGKIPEGWRVGRLVEDKISKFVKTNIEQFDNTKDYVETSNVNLSNFVGNFESITYAGRPSRANMQPVKNSFWFARMAESRKYLLFQERDNQDIETKILSTGFAGIQCIKEYLYFYWCFILSDIFNDLKNQYAEGAVQVAISNGGIQRIMLTLPQKELAKKFTETVGFCFEKISNNNSQIKTLSKLRDTLLPKLMKGEIRVKGFKD